MKTLTREGKSFSFPFMNLVQIEIFSSQMTNNSIKSWGFPLFKDGFATACPRSSDPFYTVSCYINWVSTS